MAVEFPQELTTTVLWLNGLRLDIRCVQMRPHEVVAEAIRRKMTAEQVTAAIGFNEGWLFVSADGTLDEAGMLAACPGRPLSKSYFIAGDELFHIDGRTYALTTASLFSPSSLSCERSPIATRGRCRRRGAATSWLELRRDQPFRSSPIRCR